MAGFCCILDTMMNTETPNMDYVPTFALYRTETSYKPVMQAIGSVQEAKLIAEGLRLQKFFVRRSELTPRGSMPHGMIVHSKR